MANRDVIVIGGSSGASAPLRHLLGGLPQDLPAAIVVVLHVPSGSTGALRTVSSAGGALPVVAAEDGMPIEPGRVHLAVPDHHLLVADGRLRLGRGPRENLARPAIDPLFRSAAVTYGPRVVGVLLSGLLNDGTSGLDAVQRCGGVAVVQDPADATAPEMPRNAIDALVIDHIAPASRLGSVLTGLVRAPPGPAVPVPPELRMEVAIAAGERSDSNVLRQFATPAPLICPECGGGLSQVDAGKPLRFRCQVGHAFSAEILASEKEGAIDEALRVALRIIEERAELVQRMASDAQGAARPAIARMYEERAAEYRQYAETIRRAVLLSLPSSGRSNAEGPAREYEF